MRFRANGACGLGGSRFRPTGAACRLSALLSVLVPLRSATAVAGGRAGPAPPTADSPASIRRGPRPGVQRLIGAPRAVSFRDRRFRRTHYGSQRQENLHDGRHTWTKTYLWSGRSENNLQTLPPFQGGSRVSDGLTAPVGAWPSSAITGWKVRGSSCSDCPDPRSAGSDAGSHARPERGNPSPISPARVILSRPERPLP